MATKCAIRAAIVGRTSSSSTSFASSAAKLKGFCAAKPTSGPRLSLPKLKFSRLPAELGGVQSLMPLHSVTASALLTSLLSLNQGPWGCLSEGLASTL